MRERASAPRIAPTPLMDHHGPHREALAREFGRSAAYYREHARVQKEAAHRLVELLEPRAASLPPGPVLEVGCGTGFVSDPLCRLLPKRELHLTDLSREMVRACEDSLAHHGRSRLSFFTADAETWDGEARYAMIVAAFVAQWFRHPAGALRRLAEALVPGGLLLVSLPTEGSFPEWRRASEDAGQPFGGEPLPRGDALAGDLASSGLEVRWAEESFTETYARPLEFFHHLRRIGAANRGGRAPGSAGALRRLVRVWEEREGTPARVSYRVLFLGARRAPTPASVLEAAARESLP